MPVDVGEFGLFFGAMDDGIGFRSPTKPSRCGGWHFQTTQEIAVAPANAYPRAKRKMAAAGY
jgi:hypothetical protein